jgi:putative polyketide hydroxylase
VLPEYIIFVYFRAPWRSLIAGHAADAVQIRNADVEGIFLLNMEEDFGLFMMTYQPVQGKTLQRYTAERCRELIRKAAASARPRAAMEWLALTLFLADQERDAVAAR